MNAESQDSIVVAFTLTDGLQVILTSISAREHAPCKAGDQLLIRTSSGREELSTIRAIEYARKEGGEEFYGLTLKGDEIAHFDEFSGGMFEIHTLTT